MSDQSKTTVKIPTIVKNVISKNTFDKVSMSVGGGHVAEFPYHALTRANIIIPNYRRKITLDIHTWVGTSAIGAMHYYPKINLERIPFLSIDNVTTRSKKPLLAPVWRNCWDDPEEFKSCCIEQSARLHHYSNELFEDDFPFTYDEVKVEGLMSHERAYEWLVYTLNKRFPLTKYDWSEAELKDFEHEY